MKRLDVQELLAAARLQSGCSDFGPPDFLESLNVLVEGLVNEAGIAEDRCEHLQARLVRLLVNRAWFAKDLSAHPEILREDLGRPIVISTLPRTGSTKLHRLLAASGDFQTLSFWKVHMPSRIPREPDGGVARRVAETREFERWMYETSPAILRGHPQFTEEAEECQWLMEASFRHPIHFGLFESRSYLEWLAQADMRPTFDYFRQQLQYLQWQFPADRGHPWLLKSPSHFGSEARLLGILPGLRLIVTHRDPAKAMASIATTTMSARRLYSNLDSSTAMAANMVGMFSLAARQHLCFRDANPQVPVLDLAFREVTDDGVATAQKVYDFLGMKLSPAAERRMREWESANGLDRHGSASYSAAEYGMSEAAVRDAYAPYIERFGAYL